MSQAKKERWRETKTKTHGTRNTRDLRERVRGKRRGWVQGTTGAHERGVVQSGARYKKRVGV